MYCTCLHCTMYRTYIVLHTDIPHNNYSIKHSVIVSLHSHRIGRRKTILIFVFVKLGGNLISIVAGIYEVWALGRFIIGVGACGTYLTMFVLG